MSDYVISATLELKDKLTAKINDAKKGMDSFKSSANGVSGSLDAAQGAMAKTGASAVKVAADTDRLKRSLQGVKGDYAATVSMKDNLSAVAGKAKESLRGLDGKSVSATIGVKDSASSAIRGIKSSLQGMKSDYLVTVSAKDNASAEIKGINGNLQGLKGVTVPVNLKDEASAGISRIKNELTSLAGRPIMPQLSIRQNVRGLEIPAIQPKNVTVDVTGRVNSNLSAAAEQVKGALQGIRPSYSVTLSAKDEASRVASGAKNTLQGIRGIYSATISAKDNASAAADKAQSKLQGIRNSYTASIFAKDNASNVIGKVKTGLHDVSGQYSATISAKDDASGIVGRVRSGLQGLQGRAASTSVYLRDEASAGIARVKEELTGLTGKAYTAVLNFKQNTGGLSGMGEKAAGVVSGVANGMLMNTSMQMAGAAGIGFGIYDTIKSYTDFEAQMKKVQAIADVSQDDFSALTEKAKEMGAITQFSATQAGQGLEYMAMAGWKTDQMLSGLPGIMNLAAASGEDLGRVSDIVTDALSAFGLQAEDSAHFADVLAKAATNSNTNVGLMGETFKYVAPIAGALKYSVEDVGLAIGLMANSGIKASEAGTSLRSIFVRMSAPPADAAKALNALGVSIKNTDGTVKPFRQTMLDLRKAFAGLSEVDKADFASKIAGQEAMSGLLAIVNASDSDFEKLEDALDHSDGAAAKAAATMNDNLKGALVSLSSAWESFQIEIMSGKAGEGIRSFVEGVRDDVTRFKDYIKDGLDISDVGHIAADVITQLKNKFLELDGIGSVLAGGALAFGLYKIIGLTKRAVSAVKDLFSAGAGKSGGGISAGGTTAAREIVINASSVVVNGKSVSSNEGIAGAGETAAGGAAAGGAAKGTGGWRGRLKAGGKLIGGAAAISGILAGLDIYSTHADASKRLQDAQENVAWANSTGNPDLQAQAQENLSNTESYNNKAMASSIGGGVGGTVGTVAGAALGTAVGGPVGTVIGGAIGGALGDAVGSAIASFDWGNEVDYVSGIVSSGFQRMSDAASGVLQPIGDAVSNEFQYIGDIISNEFEYWKDLGLTVADFFVGLAVTAWESIEPYWSAASEWFDANVCQPIENTAEWAWDGITNTAQWAYDGVTSLWSTVSEWFDAAVWQPVSNTAQWAWNGVTNTVQWAWNGIVGLWGAAASWFEATVWQPIASRVESVKTTIVNAFSSAVAGVKAAWSGIVGWFESNIIGPLREKFNSIRSWAGGVVERGRSFLGHNASGTSYYSGGWTEINEQGGEIVDLPRGSRIYPHATTIRMLKEMFEDSRPQTLQTVLPKAEMPEPVMNVAVPKAEMPEPVYKPVLSVPSLSGMLDDMAYPPEPSQPMGMQPEPAYQPELPSQQIVVNTSRDSTPASAQPPTINITGNSFTVREEADIDRIAYRLMQLIQKAQSNMNYVGQGAFV